MKTARWLGRGNRSKEKVRHVGTMIIGMMVMIISVGLTSMMIEKGSEVG